MESVDHFFVFAHGPTIITGVILSLTRDWQIRTN